MTKVPRFVGGDSGASMVEFAIVLPVLFLFAFGIVEFGRAFKQYNNLASAVRDAARFGAARKGPLQLIPNIKARVDTALWTAAGGGLPSPNAAVTVDSQNVVVTVANYQYQPLSFMPGAQNLKFTVSATFRREDK